MIMSGLIICAMLFLFPSSYITKNSVPRVSGDTMAIVLSSTHVDICNLSPRRWIQTESSQQRFKSLANPLRLRGSGADPEVIKESIDSSRGGTKTQAGKDPFDYDQLSAILSRLEREEEEAEAHEAHPPESQEDADAEPSHGQSRPTTSVRAHSGTLAGAEPSGGGPRQRPGTAAARRAARDVYDTYGTGAARPPGSAAREIDWQRGEAERAARRRAARELRRSERRAVGAHFDPI